MAKVALSYGHGSNTFDEKGSKGVYKNGKAYEEHTFNATVGEKVRKILQAHGVSVLVLQPAFGRDVSLSARTSKANAWGADIYWSIHANAGTSSARGLAGFYWSTSSQSKKLAQLYAKYCKAENFPVYSGDYMYPSQRGTWSDFHELRESAMPALLTENGFMTNAEDFKLIFLNAGDFHNRLARAHAKAILEYFGIKYDSGKAGESKPAPTTYKPTEEDYDKGRIGRATITTDVLNFREGKSLDSKVIKTLKEGSTYFVYAVDGKWYNLGGGWASAGSDGSLLDVQMFPKRPVQAPAPKGDTHTVKSGDTLWELAQDYNTSVAKLKELNGLKSDLLSIGQVLRVNDNAPQYHVVKSGDTLWGLSRDYKTTVAKIKSLNGLKSDVIGVGDKLRVK